MGTLSRICRWTQQNNKLQLNVTRVSVAAYTFPEFSAGKTKGVPSAQTPNIRATGK